MKTSALALLAALAFAPVSTAHAADPAFTSFEAIDEVWNDRDNKLFIVGLVQGEAEPRRVEKTMIGSIGADEMDRCLRAAQVAMLKPGVFLFSIANLNNGSAPHCKLTRR